MSGITIATIRGAELIAQSQAAEPASLDQSAASDAARLRLWLRDSNGRARLDPELILQLKSLLENQREARLVTIEGTPGSFCEGLELELLPLDGEGQGASAWAEVVLQELEQLLEAITYTPRPVVALVDGPALGGGLGIAAAADLVIATPRASFALPEAIMGLIPAVVFPFVAHRIGVARARLLALGSPPLDAAQALEFGLVDEIAEDLESALDRYARRFIRMDSRAIGTLKKLVATHFEPSPQYKADALKSFSYLLKTKETRQRISRFYSGATPWDEEDAS